MKPTKKNVLYMLEQSNAIEMVYDKKSLEDSYAAWKYIMKHQEISVDIILETHRILMSNQNIEDRYKGQFRDVPVTIGGEVKSLPRIVVTSLVQDLCDEMNKSELNFDPVNYHVQFENIHPFIDGNGRIGRIILNWQLVKRFKSPLLVYTEEDKQTYYMLFPSYRSMVHEKMWEQLFPEIYKNAKQNNNNFTNKPS